MALRRSPLGRRGRRRPIRRVLRVFEELKYGYYIEVQWSKDTEGHPGWSTDVQLSIRTLVYFENLAEYRRFHRCIYEPVFPGFLLRFALRVRDLMTPECALEAFVTAAENEFGASNFVNRNYPNFFRGLSPEPMGEEFRKFPVSVLKGFADTPRYPYAKAVLRIMNYRGSRSSAREYEYWVVFNLCDCSDVVDWDVGQRRPGRRRRK